MHGLIRDKWGALGWENSLVGFPVSDELRLVRGGALSRFQGGSVYWSAATGAHEVHGDILRTYGDLQWETGRLGYPVSDEQRTPDRDGAYSLFERGAVYWSEAAGAHQVEGLIRAKWEAIGAEGSSLGLTVSNEEPLPGGRVSDVELGQIQWTAALGAVVTRAVDEVSAADVAARTVRTACSRPTAGTPRTSSPPSRPARRAGPRPSRSSSSSSSSPPSWAARPAVPGRRLLHRPRRHQPLRPAQAVRAGSERVRPGPGVRRHRLRLMGPERARRRPRVRQLPRVDLERPSVMKMPVPVRRHVCPPSTGLREDPT